MASKHLKNPTVVKCEKGATALEFALASAVFIPLLSMIIEFGVLIFVSSIINGAVYDGTRLAQSGFNANNVRNTILDKSGGLLNPARLNIATSTIAGGITAYSVEYRWPLFMTRAILPNDNGDYVLRAVTAIRNE